MTNPAPLPSHPSTGQAVPKRPIYLDYQATTPTDPRVVEAMLPWFYDRFGNPHSRNHPYGWESEAAVKSPANISPTCLTPMLRR
jgi:cysteine desulfurase